ncbi:MAG: class II aldolase/adducin family protein [Thermoplasmata archaeon]
MDEILPGRFSSFFMSNRPSTPKFIHEIINCNKKLGDAINYNVVRSMSTKCGHRFMITCAGANIAELSLEDAVEVADYDPVRNTMMLLGAREPNADTPLHWLIYKAFPNINGAARIYNESIIQNNDILKTKHNIKHINFETSLEIAETLKKNNCVVIGDLGLIVIGKSLNEVANTIINLYNNSKSS